MTAAPPHQETFLICPDGHSGVATNVTSCQFAMNVHASYDIEGGPSNDQNLWMALGLVT